jgi:hypothetical protein
VRLVGDLPGFDMPPADLQILDRVIHEFGAPAANSLKDLSYQTAPMIDAQQPRRGRR